MDQRKAFLFFGFMILVWTVFWNTSLRVAAVKKNAGSEGDSRVSAALRGLLVAV